MKSWAQRAVPERLIRMCRCFRQSLPRPPIWEGIYSDYGDLPNGVRGYNSSKLVEDTFRMTRALLDSSAGEDLLPVSEKTLLPLLIAVLCREGKPKMRILDFGGGMGIMYIYLRKAVRSDCQIDYHIVEQVDMCTGGSSIFRDEPYIRFTSSLPEDESSFDIVYISSALQYIEDYVGLLKRLSLYSPHFFLFDRFPAGSVRSFISIQKNIEDALIPCRFFNLGDFASMMSGIGYKLTYTDSLTRKFDMRNFPPAYRLEHHINALFARATGRPPAGTSKANSRG